MPKGAARASRLSNSEIGGCPSTVIPHCRSLAEPEPETADEDLDVDLRLVRFEALMDRRPLLLNSVLLRQNPHNAHEWHKRAQLYVEKQDHFVQPKAESDEDIAS